MQTVVNAAVAYGISHTDNQGETLQSLRMVWSRKDGVSHVARIAGCVLQGDAPSNVRPNSEASIRIEVLGPMGLPVEKTVLHPISQLQVVMKPLHVLEELSGGEYLVFSINGAALQTRLLHDKWATGVCGLRAYSTCVLTHHMRLPVCVSLQTGTAQSRHRLFGITCGY